MFEEKDKLVNEYNFEDKNVNYCICSIDKRYLLEKFAMNTKCKEVVLILDGEGFININNVNFNLKKDDAILIEKEEKFFWQGKIKIVFFVAMLEY